jgi:hypothetical protein
LLAAALGGCGDSGDSGGGGANATAKDNGVAEKSANQIVREAAAALKRARSVRVEGTLTIDGKRTAARIDLEQPKNARISYRQKNTSAEMVLLRDSAYIKANEAFWREQGARREAPELADQWFKLPGTAEDLRELTRGTDIATLSRCLADFDLLGSLSVAGRQTVNGQPAVVVVDKGDRPGTTPSKLFVATTGEPRPLRATATGRERPGGKRDPECNDPSTEAGPGDELTFSRYNKDLEIEAPPGARDLTPGRSAS